MKHIKQLTKLASLLVFSFTTTQAFADDLHPMISSKYWVSVGAFYPARNFSASAEAPGGQITPRADFESSLGIKDRPNILMAEFGWRFSDRWDVSLQRFASQRDGQATLQESIEWDGVTYDAGVDVSGKTKIGITRLVFSREFRDQGPHSLRLAAGLHLLNASAEISGVATLNDQTQEFRASKASASIPIPNLGAWYRYSPSDKWLLTTRVDWFSANIGNFSGGIWNVSSGVNYSINKHFGVGLNYQYFELDGRLNVSDWRGELKTRFTGPFLHIDGYW